MRFLLIPHNEKSARQFTPSGFSEVAHGCKKFIDYGRGIKMNEQNGQKLFLLPTSRREIAEQFHGILKNVAILLIVSMFIMPVLVNGAESYHANVSVLVSEVDNYVEATLYLDHNNGILGFHFSLFYDEYALTPVSVVIEESDFQLEVNQMTFFAYSLTLSRETGVIATVTFSVNNYEFQIYVSDFVAIIYEDLEDNNIPSDNYFIGDINGDGVVDGIDLLILGQYIHGLEGVVINNRADVNADGVIDYADLSLLIQYITLQPVMLGPQPGVHTDLSYMFTCPVFYAYVRRLPYVPENEPILAEHLRGVSRLNLGNKGISSLSGIQYFVGLEELFAQNNNLNRQRISLNNNPDLRNVVVQGSNIGALFANNLPNLRHLNAAGNNMTYLNVRGAERLTALSISNNNLRGVSGLATLSELRIFWAENNNFGGAFPLPLRHQNLIMVDVRGNRNPDFKGVHLPDEFDRRVVEATGLSPWQRDRIRSGFVY